jgi:fatty acid desaturase
MSVEPGRRVRVAHPRTDATRRSPARTPTHEIGEQTQLGEAYMSSLIRSQGRLGAVVCVSVLVLLVGTAMIGALVPTFARLRLFGVPLPWLVLGVLVYPVLIALAAYAVRQAERNERAFSELVRLSSALRQPLRDPPVSPSPAERQ